MIISVDGGTTNTRITLIDQGEILSDLKIPLGAGGASAYITPLHDSIGRLLEQQNAPESALETVILSGMICSEAGLRLTPHISAPADPQKTAAAMERVCIPEITKAPIYLVPGLKTDTDMMRGEETELFGIWARLELKNFIAVMPGSHTKIVHVGKGGEIGSFCTAVTGELIRASAEHTILRTALEDVFTKNLDLAALEAGADTCKALGLNQALFQVRVRQKNTRETPEQLYAFLCGVCLRGDIEPIRAQGEGLPVYVGGSDPFRRAYRHLLQREGHPAVFEIPEPIAEHAAAYGAQVLWRYRK